MITLVTKVNVEGVSGREITDFMLRAGDEAYQRWWPGTHFRFHSIRRVPGDVGSLVYFDELVGKRRVKMEGVVRQVIPGKRLVWQMQRGVRLPAWLVLELEDYRGGVTVTHTIRAGFTGALGILDPLLRLYLTPGFQSAMDEHARVEFRKLGELLHEH